MSLPVVNFDINYADEKGMLHRYSLSCLRSDCLAVEKIEAFLSTFEGKDRELSRGFADLDLDDENDVAPPSRQKYMKQLVRVSYTFPCPY